MINVIKRQHLRHLYWIISNQYMKVSSFVVNNYKATEKFKNLKKVWKFENEKCWNKTLGIRWSIKLTVNVTVCFALIRKSPASPEVYLVSGRCDPSVVTTIYKHCSTLSVRAHGTFPPRCWHKEVLSTTPATFTLQISARSTVLYPRRQEMMSLLLLWWL